MNMSSNMSSSAPSQPVNAIILLSGGLDSTMALSIASQQDPNLTVIKALTFNYGQVAAAQEIAHSKAIAAHFDVDHQVIELPWFNQLLPQAIKACDNPHDWSQGDPNHPDFFEAGPVWVPNRNGVLLNIAAAVAEAYQASVVLFGGNAEEAARFPDNTDDFRVALNEALSYSTSNGVEVQCPVQAMTKADMIEKALEIDAPLHLVWSCYSQQDTHCGQCPSCVRLHRAISASSEAQAKQWHCQLFGATAPEVIASLI